MYDYSNRRIGGNSAGRPAKTSERPSFRLLLRAEPNVPDAERVLRRLLKLALRRFRLRCVAIEQMRGP